MMCSIFSLFVVFSEFCFTFLDRSTCACQSLLLAVAIGETGETPIFCFPFDRMFSLVRSAVRLGAVANSAKYSARLYHDLVIDHYEHPRNVGRE